MIQRAPAYAVINGHRLSFLPIPLLHLNWEEINASYSLLTLYLQSFDRLVDVTRPPDSFAVKLIPARETFPVLHSHFESCVRQSLVEDYWSLLAEAKEKHALPKAELRLIPLLDRCEIIVGQYLNETTTTEEILHLEGGIQATKHFTKIFTESRDRSCLITEREETVQLHYFRATLAIIVTIVYEILRFLEQQMSQLKSTETENNSEDRNIVDLLRTHLPNQSLLCIAIAILMDLPLGFEQSDVPVDSDFILSSWLQETNRDANKLRFSRRRQEEVERFLLLPSLHSSDAVARGDASLGQRILPSVLQLILYNVLRFGRLLPLTSQTIVEAQSQLNCLLINGVAALSTVSSRGTEEKHIASFSR